MIGLLLWCVVTLGTELLEAHQRSSSARPFVHHPRRWSLGSTYTLEVREFARQAAAQIPEGQVVSILAGRKVGRDQRLMLQLWLAYFMPRHHLRILPMDRSRIVKIVESSREGDYFLAYRYRPVRHQEPRAGLRAPHRRGLPEERVSFLAVLALWGPAGCRGPRPAAVGPGGRGPIFPSPGLDPGRAARIPFGHDGPVGPGVALGPVDLGPGGRGGPGAQPPRPGRSEGVGKVSVS